MFFRGNLISRVKYILGVIIFEYVKYKEAKKKDRIVNGVERIQ